MYGFNRNIAHINLSNGEVTSEKMNEIWYRIYAGGGLLGTYFMLRDTPDKIDAYDPRNLLIFSSSIIAGHEAPGLARFSVITKSPLSQGIADVQSEGAWGRALKKSGFDAFVIKGKSDKPIYIYIENGTIEIKDGSFLWGKDTNESTTMLEKLHGLDIEVAVIGPAGENLVRYASIISNRSNQAMRLGVGAVMGSKNLKAIVIKGGELPPVFDEGGLLNISKMFKEKMYKNELSMWQKEAPGFTAWIDLANDDTAYLGVNNFNSNVFSESTNFSRDQFLKFYQGDNFCPGCPNDCIKYLNPKPNSIPNEVTGIHQEVSGTLGPNIGNKNLALMLEANAYCNLYGIDPVSLGFTLSFAMECFENKLITVKDTGGIDLHFGNEKDLLNLVKDIAYRHGFGDVLAEGSKRAADIIGHNAHYYALHVKGIEMVPFDPRSQTNLGLGFVTAPIGPKYTISEHDWDYDTKDGWDHTLEGSKTLGIFERVPMEYIGPTKVRNYKALNTIWSACDVLNLSIFASAPTRVYTLSDIALLVKMITGWNTSGYEIMKLGERRNHLLRIYNLREGLSAKDDRLPERFYKEKINHGIFKGISIDQNKFQEAIQLYYEMMGWDDKGVPLKSTLIEYQIEWTIPIVEHL